MRRMTGGLVAALENEKLGGSEDKKELPDHADSLETDVADINEDAAEGEAHQADTDEAEATGAALESFIVALEGMQQDGGLEPKGAMILHLSVEHLLNRVGSSGASTAVPAMESFGGSGSRLQAGQLALESLKDELNKIWQAIVAAIKKAAAWVAGYWMKVFGAAEKLQRRAKALEEAARATTGQMKQKEFEDAGLAAKVATVSNTTAVAAVNEIKEFTTIIVSRGATISGEVGKAAVAAVEKLDASNLPAILKLFEPIEKSHKLENPQEVGVSAPAEGLAVYATAELPGRRAIVSWVPAGGGDLKAQITQLGSVGYKTVEINKGAKPGTKLQTMTQADAGAVAKAVGLIAGELLAYRKNSSNLAQIQKDLATAAEGVAGKAGQEEDEAKREELSAVKSIATAANRALIEPGASFSKYAVQTCEAYLHYAEKSLKQYGA